MINVTIIFALSSNQLWQKTVQLAAGSTLEQALLQSGFYQEQDSQWHDSPCGVFGVQRARDHILSDQDQVEIYRPLSFDPMESRRRRAAHKANAEKQQDKNRRRQPSAAARMILNQ